MTIYMSRSIYSVLLTDLAILTVDSVLMLITVATGHRIDWWLPASMVFLLLCLLAMMLFAVRVRRRYEVLS